MGAKCRKEYDLDENGQRIRLESGAYKSHRIDTTDWNDKGKAEIWRSAWSDYVNRSLEQNGINSVEELHEKITAMQSDYYALRGEIVGAEREIATLTKHLEIWRQYRANKHPKTDSEQAIRQIIAEQEESL